MSLPIVRLDHRSKDHVRETFEQGRTIAVESKRAPIRTTPRLLDHYGSGLHATVGPAANSRVYGPTDRSRALDARATNGTEEPYEKPGSAAAEPGSGTTEESNDG